MKKILLLCFILNISLLALFSCEKKENTITEDTSKEEKAAIKETTDSTSIEETKNLEEKPIKELTMNELLELYENNGLALKAKNEGLEGFLAYENMKPLSGMENSLTELYICDLAYPHTSEDGITSERNYELQLSYWRPETAEKYGYTENEIDNIRLIEKETQDAVLLYDIDKKFTPTKDLQGFLQRDYEIEHYLICDLPSDFTLKSFQSDITFFDGWLLEGEVEEPPHGDSTSEMWYCPGGIVRAEIASHILKFENKTLTNASLLMNHAGKVGEMELLEGCEVQAILTEYAFELFTASSWEDYLLQHPEVKVDELLQSYYWYVFLGKEDSEIFYVLFLNQEYFTKDDIIRIAQSIQFTEKAFSTTFITCN